MIKAFCKIQETELPLCGGKGASLIKMINANYNVPDGFIIGSNVFLAFCQANHLLHTSLNQLGQAITDGVFPDDIKDEILLTFSQVFPKNTKVAVRSSALCEDGEKFAWSGELETYLFVEEKDLLDYIKKCFASIFSDRALTYAQKANVDKDNLHVAVIVQKQLDSIHAGVAFSCNPVNGINEIVIEYVEGQGEALVSGKVIPSRVIYSADFVVTEENVSASEKSISKSILLTLAKKVKQLEKDYGFPVDVEWATDNGELLFLQCRPITACVKREGLDALLPELFPITKWNFDTQTQFHYMFMHTMMSSADKKLHTEVFGFSRTFEDCIRTQGEVFKEKSAKERLQICMNSLVEKDPFFLENFAALWADVVKREEEYVERINCLDVLALSDDELFHEVQIFEDEYRRSLVFAFYFIDDFLKENFLHLLKSECLLDDVESEKVFNKIATCSNDYGTLFYSEEPVDLLKIAIKKQNGDNIENDINLHVERYAWMLAPIERTIRVFSKKDYETRINALLEEGDLNKRLDNVINTREENDKQFDEAVSKYNLSRNVLQFAHAIRTFIYYHTLLTEHTDWLCYQGTKIILSEIARRKHVPIEDIVMLSTEEIKAFSASKISNQTIITLAESRAKCYAIIFHKEKLYVFDGDEADCLQRVFVPAFVENHQKNIKNSQNISENILLSGSVCQPGHVIGKVKIVKSFADCEKVHCGDILVANMTTPTFISAMERASGFITDKGGITCHAAILSRELGVPCIVGTAIATKILQDDQIVELDAYVGVVREKKYSK